MDILDGFLTYAQRRVMQRGYEKLWEGLTMHCEAPPHTNDLMRRSMPRWRDDLVSELVSQVHPDAVSDRWRLFSVVPHSVQNGVDNPEVKCVNGSSPNMVSALIFRRSHQEGHGYNFPALIRLDDDPPQLRVFAKVNPHLSLNLLAYSAAMHFVAPKDPRYAARVSMKAFE